MAGTSRLLWRIFIDRHLDRTDRCSPSSRSQPSHRPAPGVHGTSFYFIGDTGPFLQDWALLFNYLQEGKIKPVIDQKFPILEAAQANAPLESGSVTGNLVLVSPELL